MSQATIRMPAEWERHAATWLIWPKDATIADAHLLRIRRTVARFVAELAESERVEILVDNATMADSARDLLCASGAALTAIGWHEIATDDYWLRDCGPMFVFRSTDRRTEPALVGWGFNAWGGKFPPWDRDASVPRRMAERLQMPLVEPGMILEGGSVDGNGAGVVLTTEECLLNRNRNPGLDRHEIERRLRHWLGAEQVIWLGAGLIGDHTDGHVDNVARFVDPETIVVATATGRDPNAAALTANRRRLAAARSPSGRPFRIVPLPIPNPGAAGLPASYVNFYIANRKVLVPTYRCAQDAEALDVLAGLFPGRAIVGIEASDLLTGGGAFHCITQPQPALPA